MNFKTEISDGPIQLLPFSEENITDEYISWLNNKTLMKFSEQRHVTHSYLSCLSYLQTIDFKRNGLWAIIVNNEHIGNINMYYDMFNNRANIGLLIGKTNYKGKGYGKLSFNLLMSHLFKKGVLKVSAGTMSLNLAMLNIMQRCGMIEDGVQRKHFLFEGKYIDLIHMAKFNDKSIS